MAGISKIDGKAINQHPKNERGLTEKQQIFCEIYAQSGKAQYSAIQAGYEQKWAHVRACELLKTDRVIQEIQRQRHNLYQSDAPLCRKTLLELMQDKKTPPATRAKIAADILDRAGDRDIMHQKQDKELRTEAQRAARLAEIEQELATLKATIPKTVNGVTIVQDNKPDKDQ